MANDKRGAAVTGENSSQTADWFSGWSTKCHLAHTQSGGGGDAAASFCLLIVHNITSFLQLLLCLKYVQRLARGHCPPVPDSSEVK